MADTPRARGQAPRRLILDSGAVIALARGNQRGLAQRQVNEGPRSSQAQRAADCHQSATPPGFGDLGDLRTCG